MDILLDASNGFTIWDILKSPFTWGFIFGVLFAGFFWRAASKERKFYRLESKRLHKELAGVEKNLCTQLKVQATGSESLQQQLEELKHQNETLRINLNALQQKPDKAAAKQLRIFEIALTILREEAPGFAASWEKSLRRAEEEHYHSENGLRKIIHKVLPSKMQLTSKKEPSSEQ